jgi:hypothetical protein
MLALGKGGRPLFVNNNRCIANTSTLGWRAVVCVCVFFFFACEIIQLSSVVSYFVTVVHKSDFLVVANEYTYQMATSGKKALRDRDASF